MSWRGLMSAGWCLLVCNVAWSEIGEFDIRGVMPLEASELAELRRLVAEEEGASAIALGVKKEVAAKGLLESEPDPLEVIHYEGLVNTDPRRIATVAKLREMDDVALLVRYWQLTGSEEAAAALERYIAAWAETYVPTGNDVNENKFYPLFVAYAGLRDAFTEGEREQVDAWVEEMAERHVNAVREEEGLTNRYTKHLRLTAVFARILDRPKWMEAVEAGIRRFVSESLYADGTSRDLKRRDTLTYHGSALKPILELAMAAGEEGERLYRWEGAQGGSLKKSVDYVAPYALGEKTREEWVNSKIDLDRRRAEAGLEKYRRGRLFDPQDALELMEDASYFDLSLRRVVAHLRGIDDARFASWQMLMNAVVGV